LEKVYRILRIIIIGARNVKDTQCGFKVFTRRAMLDIFPYLTVERFAFDSEVIFLAKKRRYEIKELPITLQNPTVSSIRIYSDSINMFLDLLRIRKNDILGKYNLKI
jgi:dolichyl-phosphate beta-glucosyltransferase